MREREAGEAGLTPDNREGGVRSRPWPPFASPSLSHLRCVLSALCTQDRGEKFGGVTPLEEYVS